MRDATISAMWRQRTTTALLCVVGATILLACPSGAFAGSREGTYMRFSIGQSHIDLVGLSEKLNEVSQARGAVGPPINGETTAMVFGFDVGALITDSFAVGGRFAWHHGKLTANSVAGKRGFDFNVFELLGDVSVVVPSRSGVIFGARAGIGFDSVGQWGESSRDVFFGLRTTTKKDGSTWSTITGVLELYSGLQLHVSNKFVPFLRGGYSSRDFGDSSGFNDNSEPLNRDYSGWFVEVGFGGVLRKGARP